MLNYKPSSIDNLLKRSAQLTNKLVVDIAHSMNIVPPQNLKRAKGWQGQLVETFLGAQASSRAIPDFPELGIELKTLPINQAKQPIESTYVCVVPNKQETTTWQNTWVYKKLRHVLWVPIEVNKDQDLTTHKFKQPFLWQPSAQQDLILQQDWEDLSSMLYMGHADKLTATYGTSLHIRPKASNCNVTNLTKSTNLDADTCYIIPKGYYLRTSFTKSILCQVVN